MFVGITNGTSFFKNNKVSISEVVGFRRLMFFTSIVVSILLFIKNGIPLLSNSPDIARMEFMTPDIEYKYYANFIPFLLFYQFLSFYSSPRKKLSDYFSIFILFLIYAMSGHKAGIIIGVILGFYAYECAGFKIKYRVLVPSVFILFVFQSHMFFLL